MISHYFVKDCQREIISNHELILRSHMYFITKQIR